MSQESATLTNGRTVLLEATVEVSGPAPAAGPATRDTDLNCVLFCYSSPNRLRHKAFLFQEKNEPGPGGSSEGNGKESEPPESY